MHPLKICAALALLSITLLPVTPAAAQATRTWVSGVGDDVNPCSRTAPCKTFAGAISKTAVNGEINIIDAGAFGTVTITKSISIVAEGFEAGVLGTGANGIIINAGVNDVVVLRGLDIDGSPGAGVSPGLNGIRFLAGAALHIQKCQIRNFRGAAPNGFGINFAPSAGSTELYVSDTILINNGDNAAANGGGILIQPTGSGSARAVLERVQVENSRLGLQANTTSTTGTVSVVLNNSTVLGNTNNAVAAVTAAAAGTAASIMVNRSVLANNATAVVANGSAATVRIANTVVTGNTTGAAASNSGTLLSYKNNMIDGNTSNGTPITQVNLN